MSVIILRFTLQGVTLLQPDAALPDPDAASGDLYWLDVDHASQEEWDALLSRLNMPEEDKTFCMLRCPLPQAESLTHGITLCMPTRNAWQDEVSDFVHILAFPNLLVTRHEGELGALVQTRRRFLGGEKPGSAGIPGIMLSLLHEVMGAGMTHMLDLRAMVGTIEDRLEDNPELIQAPDIRRLRHDVQHISSQTEDQIFCIALLRGLLTPDAPLAIAHSDVDDVREGLAHLLRCLERLEDRLAGFLQQCDSHLRNRTDQRLRILTLVSAVLMPLTFITGFYGMNFDAMDALHTSWGYPLALVSMAALAATMLGFFWWKGWFK